MKTFEPGINPRFANKRGFTFSVSGQTQQDNPKEEIVPKYYTCNYRKCSRRDVVAPSNVNPATVYCSQRCLDAFNADVQRVMAEVGKFAGHNADIFYRHPANAQALADRLEKLGLEPTAANFDTCFVQLLAERALLLRLTTEQVEQMSPKEFTDRERIDPAMGGCDLSQLVNRGRGKEPKVFTATQNNRQLRAEMVERAQRENLARYATRRRG